MAFPENLESKRVIVTGGANGIGRGIVERFIDAGSRVFILDVDPAAARQASEELGAEAAIQVDICSEAGVERAVSSVSEMAGGIDILVNNAGQAQPVSRAEDTDLATWRQIVEVNLQGAFLVSREAFRHFPQGVGGAIVNISSVAGIVGLTGSAAYGSAKAGLIYMTRAHACEWARHGIRVNCVAPGLIMTDAARKFLESGSQGQKVVRHVPMRRAGEVSDIAHAVAFLSSDAARYVTGTTLAVDGGWTASGEPSRN